MLPPLKGENAILQKSITFWQNTEFINFGFLASAIGHGTQG